MYIRKFTIWDCGRPGYGGMWDNIGIAPYGIGGRDLADTNPPGVDGIPYGGYNKHKLFFIFKYNFNFFTFLFWSIYLNIFNCKQYIIFFFRDLQKDIYLHLLKVIYIFFKNRDEEYTESRNEEMQRRENRRQKI